MQFKPHYLIFALLSAILLIFSVPPRVEGHASDDRPHEPDPYNLRSGLGDFVGNFEGGDRCSGSIIPADDLPNTDKWRDIWREYFNWYGYVQVVDWMNKNVEAKDFKDYDYWVSWGSPPTCPAYDFTGYQGADAANTVFLKTHGVYYGWAYPTDNRIALTMGDAYEAVGSDINPWLRGACCFPEVTSQIILGNSAGEANVFVAHGCGTAQHDAWQAGSIYSLRGGTGFNTYNGFHGVGYHSYRARNNFEDYLEHSMWNGVGSHWVSEATHDYPSSNDDACAVSIIWASSLDEAKVQYYEGGFMDQKATGWGGWAYVFVNGCDPEKGYPL